MWMSINESYLLTVQHDDFFVSPRRLDENFGTMVCFHRRYDLGDEHNYDSSDDFIKDLYIQSVGGGEQGEEKYEALMERLENSSDTPYGSAEQIRAVNRELMAQIEKENVVLPLYLLDHSGLAMNTTGFNDSWDSGQVGLIYVSNQKNCEEYGVECVTPSVRQQAENQLRREVEVYDAYLHGECYGYELYKNGELTDSCWGFIGSFDTVCKDITEYLPDECKGMTDKLSEVNDPASMIKTLLKHARIHVEQAANDYEYKPRQQALGPER